MTFLHRLRALWRNLRHSAPIERRLDEELAAYEDLLADEKEGLGLDPTRARRAARIELGGAEVVKEGVRDVRSGAFLSQLLQDARYGGRLLARSPGFTISAVLALALGIGATAALFSVFQAVLLRPLPYAAPQRLVVVLEDGVGPVSPANFLDWRRLARSFGAMGAAEIWSPTLTGGAAAERLQAVRVTADLLPLLGVRPSLGRTFVAGEDGEVEESAVVLSHGLWRRRFGGDPEVLGRTIQLDGAPYAVIGVMPPGFEFPPFWAVGAELWAPLPLAARSGARDAASLRVFARLAPGTSLAAGRQEMAAITSELAARYPGTNQAIEVDPLAEPVVGDVRRALWVLLGAVGLLLLIACSNVAHLLLARAAGRRREMAVRTALGAGRGRMLRQLLTESLVLAVAGGLAAIPVAAAMLHGLGALAATALPRAGSLTLDGRVLAIALVVSLAAGVLSGAAPALLAARRQPRAILQEAARGSSETVRGGRVRDLLVATQIALALVLLFGAGLMARSFVALRSIDPGFDPDGVVSAVVSVAGAAASPAHRRLPFYRELLDRVRALPGVESASAINHLPLAGDRWALPFRVEGRPPEGPGDEPSAVYRVILPGYFRTMRIPLELGRELTAADRLGAPEVVIVNRRLAELSWPGQDPLGRRLTLDDLDEDPTWWTVVGVVGDPVSSAWGGAPEPELYLPFLQSRPYLERPESHYAYLTLVVRGDDEAAELAPALRRVVATLDRGVPVFEVQSMEEVIAGATARPRLYLALLVAFGLASLALAALGVHGVISYSVARRRRDIGLRMALGATASHAVRLVAGRAVGVALVGAIVGMFAAGVAGRLLEGLLHGVEATDPATLAAVAAVLCTVAIGAALPPARRAARIDPLAALREE